MRAVPYLKSCLHAICWWKWVTLRGLSCTLILEYPTSLRLYYERVNLAACYRHLAGVTCIKMANESADMLHNLKRRRTRERTNANRFSTMLEGFEDSSFDDIEHYRGRLQETLDRLISLACAGFTCGLWRKVIYHFDIADCRMSDVYIYTSTHIIRHLDIGWDFLVSAVWSKTHTLSSQMWPVCN